MRFGQMRSRKQIGQIRIFWPNAVLAKCGLAKCGHDRGACTARGSRAVCRRAREDKERKYPELLRDDRCRLVVVALETGGRWSEEATQFVESLAVNWAPPTMQHSAGLAWRRRWTWMLAAACARSSSQSPSRPRRG